MRRKVKAAWATDEFAALNPKANRDSWGAIKDERAANLVYGALAGHEHKACVIGGLAGNMCGVCYGNLIELVHSMLKKEPSK